MFEQIVDRYLSLDCKSQMTCDLDMDKEIFCFAVPIYFSDDELPEGVKKYVGKRAGQIFKPHKTSFEIRQDKVYLRQEVPFEKGFQETLRKQTVKFLELAQGCRKMVIEMVVEDKMRSLQDNL